MNEIKTLGTIHRALSWLDPSGVNETVTQAMTMVYIAMENLRDGMELTSEQLFNQTLEYCTADDCGNGNHH